MSGKHKVHPEKQHSKHSLGKHSHHGMEKLEDNKGKEPKDHEHKEHKNHKEHKDYDGIETLEDHKDKEHKDKEHKDHEHKHHSKTNVGELSAPSADDLKKKGASKHSLHGGEHHKDHEHKEHKDHEHKHHSKTGVGVGELSATVAPSADDLKKKGASKHSLHGGEHHHHHQGHHHKGHDTSNTDLNPTPGEPPLPPIATSADKQSDQSSTRTTAVFTELNKIPKMKEFLAGHVSIAEQFKKHPEIAETVARDPNLTKKIMDNPLLVQQMIDTKSANLSDPSTQLLPPKPSVQDDGKKGIQSTASSKDALHTTADATTTTTNLPVKASMSTFPMAKGPATLPPRVASKLDAVKPGMVLADVKVARKVPSAIKYLDATSRIFLLHHVEIKQGCCGKKVNFYDILDGFGKPLYRAFEGKVSSNVIIREMDGSEIIVLQKHISIFKKSLDIFCPPGSFAGRVVNKSGPGFEITYHVKDELKITDIIVRPKKLYRTKKYRSVFEMIHLTENGKVNIGEITGEWLDLPKEGFSSNQIYGVNFPQELNSDLKIEVLGAWFLLYKLIYEGSLQKDKVLEKDRRSVDLVGVKKPSKGTALPGSSGANVNEGPPQRKSILAQADTSRRGSHKAHLQP